VKGLLLLSCVLLSGLATAAEPVTLGGLAYFSLPWTVKLAALPEGTSQPQLQEKLQGLLDRVNTALSTWQSDTELMRFNHAPAGQWVPVSPILYHAVDTAQQVSALSSGAFDITVGPLVDLWGFGPKARARHIPTPVQIRAARRRVGWQHVELDKDRQALRRTAAVQLDLSSVGEGAGVDAMADYLDSIGIHDYMAEVAGTFRVHGHKPDGTGWVIAIEKPDGSGLPQRALNLQDQVVSSSGLYRNYYTVHGVRYAHIIDPASGRPVHHHAVSVTVIEPPGTPAQLADASATAFNVLGPDKGYALAVAKHLPVFFIISTPRGFVEKYTPEFAPFLAR
jgi:thiamine biosynthesis lipoprotein